MAARIVVPSSMTVVAGKISPWNVDAQTIENPADHPPVIDALFAPGLVGQDCLDGLLLKIAHV